MRAYVDWSAGTEPLDGGHITLADAARVDAALREGCRFIVKNDFGGTGRVLQQYTGFTIIEDDEGGGSRVVFEFDE